jgi:hypothetical protein
MCSSIQLQWKHWRILLKQSSRDFSDAISNSSGEEIAPAFVERENVLPFSQELTTGSNPEPENSMHTFI